MVKVLEIQSILGDNLAGQRADKVLIDAEALYKFMKSPDFTVQQLQHFVTDCKHIAYKGHQW